MEGRDRLRDHPTEAVMRRSLSRRRCCLEELQRLLEAREAKIRELSGRLAVLDKPDAADEARSGARKNPATAGRCRPAAAQLRNRAADAATATGSETALGDVSLSWTRQLSGEKASWPGIFGSLAWISRSGTDGTAGQVPTGGGFNVPIAGITAVKRRDPRRHAARLGQCGARLGFRQRRAGWPASAGLG